MPDAATEPLTTAVALDVVDSAPREAIDFKADVVGQEHLLLAIGARPDCLGARALGAVLHDDPGAFRTEIAALMRPRFDAFTASPQPTPRVLKALEEAHAEARDNDRATTTADILIGILRSHVGVGFQLLSYAGVTADELRAAVAELLASSPELATTEPALLPERLKLAAAS